MVLLLAVVLAFIAGFLVGGIVIMGGHDEALARGLVYSKKKVYVCKPLDASNVRLLTDGGKND